MKILSVADLHYTLKQWDWVKQVSDQFDLVIIPGDLLDIVSPVPIDVQILVLRKYLKRLPKDVPVLISSGNHDGDVRNEAGESSAAWLQQVKNLGAISADGDSYEKDGILFTVCPWWDGEHSKAELAEQLKRDAAKQKDQWVWVYHAPPSGSPLAWDGKKEYGDGALLNWIEQYQPDVVLGGHIHHAPFTKNGTWHDRIGDTLLFNAGKQIGPVPAFIELDTEAQTAVWRSLLAMRAM
ncbi:MAG: metallophosphoesterase [Verrucomicrobiales bacterium]|nr:metallophosphoesterase [Verrucomicrobiales bacterium]